MQLGMAEMLRGLGNAQARDFANSCINKFMYKENLRRSDKGCQIKGVRSVVNVRPCRDDIVGQQGTVWARIAKDRES